MEGNLDGEVEVNHIKSVIFCKTSRRAFYLFGVGSWQLGHWGEVSFFQVDNKGTENDLLYW